MMGYELVSGEILVQWDDDGSTEILNDSEYTLPADAMPAPLSETLPAS